MREKRRPPAATRRDNRPRLGLGETGTDGRPGNGPGGRGGGPGTSGGTGTDTPGGLGSTAPGGAGGPATAIDEPTLSAVDEQEHEFEPVQPQSLLGPLDEMRLDVPGQGEPPKSGTVMSGIQPPTRRRARTFRVRRSASVSPMSRQDGGTGTAKT